MRSGDPCTCGLGRMVSYKSRTDDDRQVRIRYLRCSDRQCVVRGKEILEGFFQSFVPAGTKPVCPIRVNPNNERSEEQL